MNSMTDEAVRAFADGNPPNGGYNSAEVITDLARALLEARAERDRVAAENAAMQERVKGLAEAVIWCSGSNDFQEGGVAREGWLKLCAPLIQPATKGDHHP